MKNPVFMRVLDRNYFVSNFYSEMSLPDLSDPFRLAGSTDRDRVPRLQEDLTGRAHMQQSHLAAQFVTNMHVSHFSMVPYEGYVIQPKTVSFFLINNRNKVKRDSRARFPCIFQFNNFCNSSHKDTSALGIIF